MSNNTARLHGYINIDEATAQRLFSSFQPKTKIASIQLIPEGLSTTNYIVHLKNCPKKYLLKIYPEGGGNCKLEVASYRYAMERVNVPTLHFFDEGMTLFDRPYLIMDYIDGTSLNKYIINHKKFPEKIAYSIGKNLSLLHSRQYDNMALLDSELNIEKILLPIGQLYEHYFNGIAGSHIVDVIKEDVLQLISENKSMINRLESMFVFSHGDFSPSNILIDGEEKVWFIDFEYSLAAPIYYDIGKFFRDSNHLNQYRNSSVYDSFIQGYNPQATQPISNEWIKLARLMDITSMLALISREKVPEGWVKAIEEAIKQTMKILRDEENCGFQLEIK